MAENISRQEWVDRYVRDEQMVDEINEFEQALMASPEMQEDLQTVLGLRETLLLEPEQNVPEDRLLPESLEGGGNWQPLALAASVLLAAFSTVMFWKVSNDSAGLQRQLDQLNQPRTRILTVAVNIMRSAGSQAPDVIVKKPEGHSAMLLDIELAPESRLQQTLRFTLVDESGTTVLSWGGIEIDGGRAEVLLNSEQIPATALWLEIASDGGQLLERRLLEFR
jgi:hypothetical protein